MSLQRQLMSRADRQAAILRGAAEAFAAGGYAATSMEDVAAASGITKLIVYRHFDSKEALYKAVLTRVSTRIGQEFLQALTRGENESLGVRTYLTVAREDPAAFKLLFRHASREPDFASFAESYRELAAGAARALLASEIYDDVMLDACSHMIVEFLVDAVLAWLDHGAPDRDEEFVDAVTTGLHSMVESWAAALS